MPEVSASVAAPDAQAARALWFDTRRWPTFVEGFRAVVRQDPEWPDAGVLTWDSGPHHQGRTREEGLGGDVVAVETEHLRGRRAIAFADGVMTVTLTYELKHSNPVQGFFVRRAMRDSLRGTLQRFAVELRDQV